MDGQPEKRDFPFWRERISTARSVTALKDVGENISRFQGQMDIFSSEIKLNENLLAELRKMFDGKMRKLSGEKPGAKGPETGPLADGYF
jgi:hypothetical protein